jgi:hypothetical protein
LARFLLRELAPVRTERILTVIAKMLDHLPLQRGFDATPATRACRPTP